MNDSIVGCVMDSLNFYKISSYVSVDNSSWDSYLSVILGAVLTFILTILVNLINDHKQRKKEKIQLLNQIREKILEADKYAGEFLQVQMQSPNSQSHVNEFGKKVSNLEYVFEVQKLMLEDSLCEKINSIKNDMFQYQLQAMKCTFFSGLASSNQGFAMANFSQQSLNAASQCEAILNKWRSTLIEFEKEMKNIIKKM